jgi:signal transduction histidine kinase
LIPNDPERAAQMIATVHQQMREGLNELRRTVATLRTPLAVDLSLPKALLQLARDFEQATQLRIHVSAPDTLPPLPNRRRIALYRAAQEALTNVQRHAQAQTAWLTLQVTAQAATLIISDDGIGLPDDLEDNGFGLRGMRERAAQLGGEMQLTTRTEGGACVVFRLPLTVEETNEPEAIDPHLAG